MALMMARTIVMARVLEVKSFADYSGGLLVSSTFCMLGCLGLQALLQREMPVQFARGRTRAAFLLMMQSLLIAATCAVLLMIFASSGLMGISLSLPVVVAGILHGFGQQAFLVATVESRSQGQSLKFARQNLTRAVIVLAGGTAAAVTWGSALIVLIVEALISIVLMWGIVARAIAKANTGWPALFCISLRRIGAISWRSALALLAVSLVSFALLNLDRWLALEFLDTRQFAIYSFAGIVLLAAQSVQSLVNASFFPMVARRFAESGRDAAFALCAWASLLTFLGATVIALPAARLVEFIVGHWFPSFMEALGLIDVFLAISVFRISDFWGSFLVIIGKEVWLLFIYMLFGLTSLIGWFVFMATQNGNDLGLQSVATLALVLAVIAYVGPMIAAIKLRFRP
jgi:O-antigen/teichoic acid export membrane protein